MKNANIRKLKRLGLAAVGAYLFLGAPSSSATSRNSLSSSTVTNSDPIAAVVEQSSSGVSLEETATAINYEVCAAVDSWQRPSVDEQAKQLSKDPRYSDIESNDTLKRASTQFWNHQAVSFTTYGLSARMEPVVLSGLWTVTDELWSCYEPETTVAINEGDLAETWLFNQRVTALQQEGDRYLMTVEPSATGVQVVQFS